MSLNQAPLIRQVKVFLPTLLYLSIAFTVTFFEFEVDQGVIEDPLIVQIGLVIEQLE